MTYRARAAAVVAAVILVDQLTKVGYDGPVNASTAFSTGGGSQSTVQVVVGFITSAMFITWAIWSRRPWWALGLAAGGLLSNLIDRLLYGGVRDPIEFGPVVWNLADVAAAVGLIACIWSYISEQREGVKQHG